MTLLDADVTAPDDQTDSLSLRPLPAAPHSLRSVRVHASNAGARMGWSLASVLLVTLGVQAWGGSYQVPGGALISIVLIPVAFACLLRCWTDPQGPSSRLQLIIMIAMAVCVADIAAIQIIAQPFYGTDAVAFGQYAAELVSHGQNPYTTSMLPSLTEFRVPVIYNTHFLDGARMLQVSYPAGNFLPYVPFVAVGWHSQTAVVIDLVFWLISAFLMWRLLPASVRFVVPVLMSITGYVSFIVGGVNDTLYLPFLILALWRWDRFADPEERSSARWLGPIAIGLAMTVKQTPWFIFPFLLIGVALESRGPGGKIRWKVPVRYAATAGAVFFAINVPWILMDPIAWWNGSIAPLVASFVPMGQGVVNLTLAQQLGGGSLSLYTLSGALWVLMCLLALVLRYRQMKRVWLILVIVAFFFTPRSLGNYMMMMLPAALIAALTVRASVPAEDLDGVPVRRLTRFATPVLVLVLAGSLGAAVLALVVPSPISLIINDTHTNGQKMSVTDVSVTVTNHTAITQTPHFTVNRNGYITNFWYPVGSADGNTSLMLPPHASKTVTLHAPDIASMPGTSEPFQVYAYTSNPGTISSSSTYLQSTTSVILTPMAVDTPVAVGDTVTFTAQLTDRLNRDLHKAGVNLSLGQIIYAQGGLLGGEASINGQLQGATPGLATTDANGQARFTVVGKQSRNDPTYFQSWITSSHGVPSGYSNIVTVQFYGK